MRLACTPLTLLGQRSAKSLPRTSSALSTSAKLEIRTTRPVMPLLKAAELLAASFSPFQGASKAVMELVHKQSSGLRGYTGATGVSSVPDEEEVVDNDGESPYGRNNALGAIAPSLRITR